LTRQPDPIGNDLRRERGRRRLPEGAACVVCGETDPVALLKLRRSVLALHHPGGEANDPNLTVVLCLTHHRIQSSDQPGAGVELERNSRRAEIEKHISMLRGLALLFHTLALSMGAWADKLAAHVEDLDANYPGWRDPGKAKA
jgi:hypothetical protein